MRPALRRFLLGCAAGAALLLSACRAPVPGEGEAECSVCRHEGDLACVCVRIEADTPRLELDGQTYWFCSDECRTAFAADPGRYRH